MLKQSYVSAPYLDPIKSLTYAFGKNNAVIIADIDRNGYLDLVTFPSNFTVDVPLGPVAWTNQGGVFSANPTVFQKTGAYQYFRDSVAGDFNGDGYTDYFQIDTGWELNNRDPNFFFGNQPALILGGAKGLTWQSLDKWLTNQGGGKSFNHIADAADYDRDGDLDMVVGSFWDFRMYQNSGTAAFTWREDLLPGKFNSGSYNVSGTTFIELSGQYAIVAGAYRIFSLSEQVLPLSVLTQQNGQFVEAYTLARPNLGHGRERNYGAADMFNMDLNGDGREDLLVTWETEAQQGINDGLSNMTGGPGQQRYTDLANTVVSVYFQDAAGRLIADNKFYNTGGASSGAPLYFEDFNLDGYIDFWVSSMHANPARFDELVFINDGTGHFANPKNKMFNTNEAFPDWYKLNPFFFDANNDGAIDVVATKAVFPQPANRSIGEEVLTFLSDSPAYNINDNNRFLTVLADKTFDGGAGIDTAVFSGRFSDYTISLNELKQLTTTDKIPGRDGRDSFVNIERFRFDDGTIALDINSTPGLAYRLYKAALDRTPDAEGLGFWISALDNGISLQTVSQSFVDSPEFRANFYGDGSDGAFVKALYNNVLDRAPDSQGYNSWVNALATGANRADVLIGFSESTENHANTVGLIGGGIAYQEWML
jgi:hypothetical protein